ncbi:unnamed protein product [Mytilus edulis]|uniref:Uncharacterized protein n=1 Tax=Mytilus edulis TaxID=6550 RepID=A0A8S3TLF4_MYTED|nr:unnamed protein product [Mytilus edulis]
MKGSDTDIMIVSTTIQASDDDNLSKSFMLHRYDSMSPDLKPGFVLVEGRMENYHFTLLPSWFIKSSFLEQAFLMRNKHKFNQHGPAMTTCAGGKDIDFVPCIKNTDDRRMTHKQLHTLRKLYIYLLCKGCKTDLACGKTMLASWLYNQRNFNDCLQVTSFVLECGNFRGLHVYSESKFSSDQSMPNTSSSDVISHLRYSNIVNMIVSDNSKLCVTELSRFLNCLLNMLSIDDYRRRNVKPL